MAEIAFLGAVATYLNGAGLTPAPVLLGVAEPTATGELPSVTLSLESCKRDTTAAGVGKRRSIQRRTGILPRTATLDLASAFLPEDPTFPLIDVTRRTLILPHGGLVRADGSVGTLTGADLSVTIVSGGTTTPTVVNDDTPGSGEVFAAAGDGVLTFGDPLPTGGTITINYVLGAWEQDLIRLRGLLRVDVATTTVASTQALSDQVATRLLDDAARTAIVRLQAIQLTALTSVAPVIVSGSSPNASRRTARFGFTYEHEINTPESSGRVIKTIPITSTFFPEETG